MSDLKKTKESLMQNPGFAKEYERIQPEFAIMRAMIQARAEKNMTQAELAEKSGVRQSNISRIERGVSSPNISTLQQIAKGLGKELHIEFR